MDAPRPSLLRLILWPSLITLGLNGLRLWTELQGSITNATGGALTPLGITWPVLLFGAWFGWVLCRTGDGPRRRLTPLWATLAMVAMVATVASQFGAIDRGDQSDTAFQSLRASVLTIVAVSIPLAVFAIFLWRRLALALLLYAIPARATVVAWTWLAKANGWDTHYTKFGPAGIEREMGDTMLAATVAQFGFWVPFTMVAGGLTGALVAGVARRR